MTCLSPPESQQTTFRISENAILAAAQVYATQRKLSYKDWFLLADWIGGLSFVRIQDEIASADLAISLLTIHKDWNTTAAKMYFLKQHLTETQQKDLAKCLLTLQSK